MTPATSPTDPFGFAPVAVPENDLPVLLELGEQFRRRRTSSRRRASRGSSASGPVSHRAVNGVSQCSRPRAARRGTRTTATRSAAVRPGSSPASVRIWKPLQMPSTSPPVGGERRDRAHDRREARDRAAAEVVAVREAARQHDGRRPVGAARRRCARRAGRRHRGAPARVLRRGRRSTPGRRRRGSAGGRSRPAAERDLVALDQRVREELLAHALELRASPRRGRRSRARRRRAGRRGRRPTSKPRWRSELSTA